MTEWTRDSKALTFVSSSCFAYNQESSKVNFIYDFFHHAVMLSEYVLVPKALLEIPPQCIIVMSFKSLNHTTRIAFRIKSYTRLCCLSEDFLILNQENIIVQVFFGIFFFFLNHVNGWRSVRQCSNYSNQFLNMISNFKKLWLLTIKAVLVCDVEISDILFFIFTF